MERLKRLQHVLLAALIATLPFEFRSLPILSNLQWLFLAVSAVSAPIILRERNVLLRDRLALAALAFLSTQWIAAMLAPEFAANAAKGAVRITAGFTLLCVTRCMGDRRGLLHVWSVAAVLAALYGLADHAGFGAPSLFRETDFYVGGAVRLSGSFEYPNTAAAFFAISLPVVWTASRSRLMRIGGSLLVWTALVMTYSRGAMAAVLLMLLVWATAAKTRFASQPFILCGAALLALLVLNPLVYQRFRTSASAKAFAAEYEPEFNLLKRRPNEMETFVVRVRNSGTATWALQAGKPVLLADRWYDAEKKILVRTETELRSIPTPLKPQESVAITASFTTPPVAGVYLLTWDIFSPESGWLSGLGVYPGLVEVHIQPQQENWAGHGDLSRWLQRDTSRLFVANVPFSRTELWKAALGLAREHPVFGAGLDNFRLLHGKQFGLNRWNTLIRSNSLYLELLAGSGLVGLAAFCGMMAAARWTASAASIALGVFLIHGLVDVFLMTTPVYFAFWILLGLTGDGIKRV